MPARLFTTFIYCHLSKAEEAGDISARVTSQRVSLCISPSGSPSAPKDPSPFRRTLLHFTRLKAVERAINYAAIACVLHLKHFTFYFRILQGSFPRASLGLYTLLWGTKIAVRSATHFWPMAGHKVGGLAGR